MGHSDERSTRVLTEMPGRRDFLRGIALTGVAATAGGLLVHIEDGRLHIVREGRTAKFIEAVEQVTFSGEYAGEKGQQVLYVTERCVFERTHDGVELVEVAPGIDIDRDILAHMGFRPIVDRPRLLDGRLFRPEAMGLHLALHELCVPERVSHAAGREPRVQRPVPSALEPRYATAGD